MAESQQPSLSPDPFHLPLLSQGEVEVLAAPGSLPVLVDFFATWCGPCQWIVPTLRQLASTHGDRLVVGKLDVDLYPEYATEHRIGSVPTVILFHEGREIGRSIGVEPERVTEMVADYLASL
jgi:thioredoxin 1